ncbi:endoplasmin [Tanacetum coccineum]
MLPFKLRINHDVVNEDDDKLVMIRLTYAVHKFWEYLLRLLSTDDSQIKGLFSKNTVTLAVDRTGTRSMGNSTSRDGGDPDKSSENTTGKLRDVEFKVVLFVTPKAPTDLYESYYNANKSNLKLYVRRVFISDEFDEFLRPKYQSFLLGLVDSDTVPLNASQEMLQQHNSLKTIKKLLIRKALDMIHKLAEEDLMRFTIKKRKRSKNHRTMMRKEVNILRSGMGLANQLSSSGTSESKADDAFAISEDTYNEPLGRGTEIRLHLSEEAGEYLQESKLKANKEVDVEVPADEDESSNEKEKSVKATKGEEKEE